MPHYYAHRVFGDLVWASLPRELTERLADQKAGFELGLYGPDPLFFYRPWHRGPVSQEGFAQHRQGPRAVLERYRSHEKTPQALGYAAGWLCHYMLDAACHPTVRAICGGGSVGHAAIELALDRRLMKSHPLPRERRYSDEVFAAAALGCTQATPRQFRQALRGFYRFSYSTAALYRSTGDAALCAKLTARLHRAVPECAAALGRLMDCLEGDKPLNWLPQLDFNGRDCNPPSPVVE